MSIFERFFLTASVFRSKSISDITEQMNFSNMSRELRFEELRKMREQMKESEEKWQDVSNTYTTGLH